MYLELLGSKFSPSSIEVYRRCPYLWYLIYILGVVPIELDTPAVLLGRSFHQCIKKFLDGKFYNQKWLYKLWRMYRIDIECGGMKGDVGIENWWKWFQKMNLKGFKVRSIEEKYTKRVLGTYISGRLDCVFSRERRFLVVDWKTGSYEVCNVNLEEYVKESIQLFLYGHIILEKFELESKDVDIAFYYPMYDRYVSCPLIENTAESEIQKCLEGIALHNYQKVIGDDCNYCSFKEFCNLEDDWVRTLG